MTYLKCAECSQPTLRYSSTIDGLRCQTCGVAYLNTKQVEQMLAAPSEDTKRLDWLIETGNYGYLDHDNYTEPLIPSHSVRSAIDAAMSAAKLNPGAGTNPAPKTE